MNCKDCIHYEACKDKFAGLYKICVDEPEKHLELNSNVENVCSHFKDKSRFIELPCKVGDTVYCVYDLMDMSPFYEDVGKHNYRLEKVENITLCQIMNFKLNFDECLITTDKSKAEEKLKELNK